MEDVVYVLWYGGILPGIIGAFKVYLSVLQHLQQLIQLYGMQLTYLIQEEYAAVRLANRPRLGLRHTLRAQRPRSLINGVVYRAQQRVRNGSLVKAHTGGIHLHEFGFLIEGGIPVPPCFLQYKPRGAGLAAARRAVYYHMLRVWSAHCRPKGPYAVLLPHYLVHPARPCLFRQGSIQRSLSHAFQFLHLPALGAGLALALHRLSHPAGTAVSVPNISKHSQLKQYPYPNRAV